MTSLALLRFLGVALPPAPNCLDPEPAFDSTKDTENDEDNGLGSPAQTERVETEGWDFWILRTSALRLVFLRADMLVCDSKMGREGCDGLRASAESALARYYSMTDVRMERNDAAPERHG
ncbi:hypothetical protein IFM5058_05067 [Aspergillus udagawae]|nr:hypothetical protein IFM5058_05067 [Aspergillus udagawae]